MKRLFAASSVLRRLGIAFTLWAGASIQVALAEEADIYSLKAAFVFNFLHFTEFVRDEERPAPRLCVLADESWLAAFSALSGKVLANGQALDVHFLDRREALSGCWAVFVAAGDEELSRVAKVSAGHSILTIGDDPSFCERYGIISIFTENDKVRFRINLVKAKAESLTFSSQLLRLAKPCP
jgi:hypothetical protein